MNIQQIDGEQPQVEQFSIEVYVDFWDKSETFEVAAYHDNGNLKFSIFHLKYGGEEMAMNMEHGRLTFSKSASDHWHLMQDNIASSIESRYM